MSYNVNEIHYQQINLLNNNRYDYDCKLKIDIHNHRMILFSYHLYFENHLTNQK